ncbi:tRNA adenosine(34) deaminase TadA [Ketobacter sp. MCCC 1A13808]|uniref:tRNA adenosine(34) deaminase TadA n=1 Tax=Ketobacter sp. MCCC 1A13808 TaxID=2602738 RepID=UPI000F26CAF4|nr:tRNA adenosine(34) deaminase TadA [Ketobacter sp. MCCC 1A13808]MVF14187.1 tRNA adenosine(34) deaminase TadA [Ketobacter sp. MCCC 1A13808]RLP54093.1 MAG: tRNA adenosine(34) deaminase TadA [Ketobacter sp.]
MNSFSQQDVHWMQRALQLAQQAADQQEVPVGAVIVRDEQVLGEGYNCPISTCDPSAHAEMVALRKACEYERNYRIPGATLYVTVEPCSMCAGALLHGRVDRIVFGTPEPKAGAVISAQQFFDQPFVNYRIQYQGGCLEPECSQMMTDFFEQRRRLKKQLKRPPTD